MDTEYSFVTHRAISLLEDASKLCDEEQADKCPIIGWAAAKINRPATIFSNATLVCTLIVLLVNPLDVAPHLSSILAYGPAVYGTFKHLLAFPCAKSTNQLTALDPAAKASMRKWLDFWVLIGSADFVEGILGVHFIKAVFPFWWAGKSLAVIWFLLSTSRGSQTTQEPSHRLYPLSLPNRLPLKRGKSVEVRAPFLKDYDPNSSASPRSAWIPSRPGTPHPISALPENRPAIYDESSDDDSALSLSSYEGSPIAAQHIVPVDRTASPAPGEAHVIDLNQPNAPRTFTQKLLSTGIFPPSSPDSPAFMVGYYGGDDPTSPVSGSLSSLREHKLEVDLGDLGQAKLPNDQLAGEMATMIVDEKLGELAVKEGVRPPRRLSFEELLNMEEGKTESKQL